MTLDDYLNRITSQHRDKPKFIELVSLYINLMLDAQAFARKVGEAFDLDTAVGVQLDQIGEWAGITRYVPTPLTGVYFTFDTGPGFESGILRGPYDPLTGLTALPDERYRIVIKAKLRLNAWDGSLKTAVEGIQYAFPDGDPIIQTRQGAKMIYGLYGDLTPIDEALFNSGYLDFKPAGVGITDHFVTNEPIFCLDATGGKTAGFDVGKTL